MSKENVMNHALSRRRFGLGLLGVGTALATGDLVTQAMTNAASADTTAIYATVIVHGSTASISRPIDAGFVHWIGSVPPLYAAEGDEWTDTVNAALKRRVGSAWIPLTG